MRILQVIPYFYPAWAYGGPVRIAYDISRKLAERGHDVTVYTTDVLDGRSRVRAQSDNVDVDGVEIRRFRNLSNSLAHDHHLFLAPGMVWAAKRQMRTFDVVHLHEYRTSQNVVIHHYAKRHRIPYVLQAHGSLPRIMGKRCLKQLYDKTWGYQLLREASKVIAFTPTEAEQYRALGIVQERIGVVPNGIDLSEYRDLPRRGEFKSKYSIDESAKVILYLGRIHRRKGIDLLVRAFADLAKERDDVVLVVSGPDDGHLGELQKLIASLEINDKVRISGPIFGRTKLEAYVDAYVHVLPAADEPFGLTILEAWACGTPVIVINSCGIADWVKNAGGSVVSYDEHELKLALGSLIADAVLRERFGESGRRLVRDEFDWSKVITRLENVYASVAGIRVG